MTMRVSRTVQGQASGWVERWRYDDALAALNAANDELARLRGLSLWRRLWTALRASSS